MVARLGDPGTVTGMTAGSLPAAAPAPAPRPHTQAQTTAVLAAVAAALRSDGGDWAVLEAWVSALTLVTRAARRAVPEELHDLI